MMINNRAQSTGFAWIVGLALLVALGLMYIIFNQAFQTEIKPIAERLISESMANESSRNESLDNIERFNSYWLFIPLLIFILVAVYIFIQSTL